MQYKFRRKCGCLVVWPGDKTINNDERERDHNDLNECTIYECISDLGVGYNR